MDMEMWQSKEIDQLAAAIVKAQMRMKPAVKDCTNPFFKSKYADMQSVWIAVTPFCEEGIAITQMPMPCGQGETALDTQLTHVSGQWMRSRLIMPVPKYDPQGIGSAITYARRYALGCMTGVVTEEDDDGNAASQPVRKAATGAPTPVPALESPAVQPPGTGDSLIIWNLNNSTHKGKNVRELSDNYLEWYVGPKNKSKVPEFYDIAIAELMRRQENENEHLTEMDIAELGK